MERYSDNQSVNHGDRQSINQSDRLHVGYRQNQGDTTRPLSVMVDIVNHDEPSVCSMISNGPNGMALQEEKVTDYLACMIHIRADFQRKPVRPKFTIQGDKDHNGSVCSILGE